jgi:hypothetical protein
MKTTKTKKSASVEQVSGAEVSTLESFATKNAAAFARIAAGEKMIAAAVEEIEAAQREHNAAADKDGGPTVSPSFLRFLLVRANMREPTVASVAPWIGLLGRLPEELVAMGLRAAGLSTVALDDDLNDEQRIALLASGRYAEHRRELSARRAEHIRQSNAQDELAWRLEAEIQRQNERGRKRAQATDDVFTARRFDRAAWFRENPVDGRDWVKALADFLEKQSGEAADLLPEGSAVAAVGAA